MYRVIALLLATSPAIAGDFFAYVDERGDLVVSDCPLHERARPYRPGQGFLRQAAPPAGDPPRVRYAAVFASASRRHEVPISLLLAVAAAESGFRSDARSSAGAQGVMQLMPNTARELGVDDPFDPDQNIDAGARYLAYLIDRFGRFDHALAAYNAGPTRVDQSGGIPNIAETRAYVERVLSLEAAYR